MWAREATTQPILSRIGLFKESSVFSEWPRGLPSARGFGISLASSSPPSASTTRAGLTTLSDQGCVLPPRIARCNF